MDSQQRKQSRNQYKQTSPLLEASGEGMFQPRPFIVRQAAKDVQESDLKTSLIRTQRYGHHLSKINPVSNSHAQIVQPKLKMGNLPGSMHKQKDDLVLTAPETQLENTNISHVEQPTQAKISVDTGEVVQQARTKSGRISKPPQRLTNPSPTGSIKKKRINRKTGINAQKKIPQKKLDKLLDDLKKNPQQPYAHLKNPAKIGNQDFTAAQKKQIYAANLKKHGQLTCDLTGQQLLRPQKSKKGVKPSHFEGQIDHLQPWIKGGTNSFSNALLLSRYVNRFKSAK